MATTRAERIEGASSAATTTGTADLSTSLGILGRRLVLHERMRRVAVLLALGLALVVVTYWLTPTGRMTEASARAVQSTAASTETVVADIDAEVSKLQSRSTRAESPIQSSRDPFHFGAVAAPPPKLVAPAVPLVPTAPPLPKLIAITSKDTPAGTVRTATFSFGENAQLVHPGDQVAGFVVQTIGDGYVELVDPSSGLTYRVR